jgi:hypothetical protein
VAQTQITPANLQVTEAYAELKAAVAVAEPEVADPAKAVAAIDDLAVASGVPSESLDVRPPTDSEPLRQLDRLTALVEEELRKSNPNYRAGSYAPATAPPDAMSPEEESLQSYLDRFMERVTGKKPEPETAPPAEPAVDLPVAAAPAPAALDAPPFEPLQMREPVRAPECRETIRMMRDVANQNARSAVAIHAGLSHWRKTRLTFLAAIAASAVSSVCAVWHLASAQPGAIESAICAGILAGLLAGRFFLRCRRLSAPIGRT